MIYTYTSTTSTKTIKYIIKINLYQENIYINYLIGLNI